MEWSTITSRQAGIITRQQLLKHGYHEHRIDTMLRTGRLARTRWLGVYAAAGLPTSGEASQWAAVLACRGVLSHLSAATWWGIDVPADGNIHIIASTRRQGRTPHGIRIHRVPLEQGAVTERLRMPLTTRSETVLGCLGLLPLADAGILLDRALQQRWLTIDAIERRITEAPRPGNTQLRRLHKAVKTGARSEAERLMIRVLRGASIAGWTANAPVVINGRTFVVDFCFPAQRLAVEIDGFAYHSGVAEFRRDRQRQNILVSAGWTVLRFTWWDLLERPETVAMQVLHALSASTNVR